MRFSAPALALILILIVAALACPAAAADEVRPEGKVDRIGLLGYGFDASLVEAFRQALRELGHVEGRNLVIEYRNEEGKVDALPGRAAELVRLKVDVIFAAGTPSVLAARKATSTIPIVMVGIGSDPVAAGLVESYGRPGGNVTGLVALSTDLWAKRLQLLRESVPGLSRIAVLSNPTNPSNVFSVSEIRTSAASAGLKVQSFEARDSVEVERALAEIASARPEGLVVAWDRVTRVHEKEIAGFAVKHRLPTMTALREYVKAGALMSYGAPLVDQWRRGARFVDRILKGANPAVLPVEQPTVFELVINRKTAKALRLEIPPTLLLQADSVIE